MMTKKLRGHSGKFFHQNREIVVWGTAGVVGAHGHLIRGSNGLSPETKYRRSKNVFAVKI